MGGYIMSSTINADTTNGVVVTSDTSGEIELQANGVTKAKITSSGLQNASGGAIISQSGKNLIINGNMQIAQRGTSVAGITGAGYYTCDRFKTVITNGGTWTQTQSTDVPSGYGFANSLKMQCTTADTSLTSTDQISIDTRLEGRNLQHLKYGTSNAEKLTVSFWVKSNKTGTQTFEIQSVSGTFRSISSTYTIDAADTWEKKTIICDGDTVKTLVNDNTLAILTKWWLGAGSSFTSGTLNTSWAAVATADRVSSSNVNLADSTSNYINFTGIQLEVGDTATPFENIPYDMEFVRCQRYYQSSWGTDSGTLTTAQGLHWIAYSTAILVGAILFPVRMRATPTMIIYGSSTGTPNKIENVTNSLVSGTFAFTGQSRTKATQANGSGMGAGSLYQFEYEADAEL